MFLFPPRFVVPLSLFWIVFILIAFSDAAADIAVSLGAILFIGLWGLSWLARVILAIANLYLAHSQEKTPSQEQQAKKQSEQLPKKRWKVFYSTIEPIALVGSVALIVLSVPEKIRLKLSEPALTTYVQEVRAGRQSPQQLGAPPRQVGLFKVRETELLEGGIVRIITARDFIDHAGFVYLPNQPPPILGEDGYSHLYGSWWHWRRSW